LSTSRTSLELGLFTIETPEIHIIVNGIIKENLAHFKEGFGRKKRITSSLVLWSYTSNLQFVSNVLQSALEVLTSLHHELDIVDAREINPQQFKELKLVCR
jgi:hypothetical protein